MKRLLLFAIFWIFVTISSTAQWKEMNDGLDGGWIQFLESSGDKLFAGTLAGVYFSNDNGETWTLIYESYQDWHVNDLLAIDNQLYISINNGKMYTSSDDGQSWTEIIFAEQTVITDLVYTGNTIFGVTNQDAGGLYTIDRVSGATAQVPGLSYVRSLAATDSKLFVGTNLHGLFVSQDGGATWAKDTRIPNGQYVEVRASGSVVLALGSVRFISSDEGANWSPSGTPYLISSAARKEGSRVYAGDRYNALTTTDGGANWEVIDGLPGLSAITRTAGGLFAGGYSGVYRSTDGIHWTAATLGIRCAYPNTIVAQGNDLFTAVDHRVFTTSTGTWRECPIPTQPQETIASLAVSGPHILAGTYEYGIYFSADQGATWSQATGMDGARSIVACGDRVYAASYLEGLFESTNNGRSWRIINEEAGITNLVVLGGFLYVSWLYNDGTYGVSRYDVNASRTDLNEGLSEPVETFTSVGDSIFSISFFGTVSVLDSLTRTWTTREEGFANYSDMASHQERLFKVRENKTLFSDDHGFTWTDFSEGLPLRVHAGYFPKSLKVINGDLYLSTFRAGLWTTSSLGTDPFDNTTKEADLPNFTMALWGGPGPEGPPFAGNLTDWEQVLAGDQMLEGANEEVVTGMENHHGPLRLYPNPVTTQLVVSLDLLPGDHPIIEITDMGGQVITHEPAVAGNTRIDTHHLAIGVYIVRVVSLSGVWVQKFVRR